MPIRRLPKNGVIAITCPSTPVDMQILERGVRYLELLGYRTEVGESCYKNDTYFAGSAQARASELNAFFADSHIDAIFCARGGFGSMYMLPYLDYTLIRNNPKLFSGFSDITALQWAIWSECALPSLSGGMVATDMGEEHIDPTFESQFWDVIETGKCYCPLPPSDKKVSITAPVLPGTISVAAKLLGSRWFPDTTNHLLLLEDVGEQIHKLDGYLGQFLLADIFRNAAGTLFGCFTPAEAESYPDVPTQPELIERIFRDIPPPLAINIRYGHIKNKLTVPLGIPLSVSLGSESSLFNPVSIYDF